MGRERQSGFPARGEPAECGVREAHRGEANAPAWQLQGYERRPATAPKRRRSTQRGLLPLEDCLWENRLASTAVEARRAGCRVDRPITEEG